MKNIFIFWGVFISLSPYSIYNFSLNISAILHKNFNPFTYRTFKYNDRNKVVIISHAKEWYLQENQFRTISRLFNKSLRRVTDRNIAMLNQQAN